MARSESQLWILLPSSYPSSSCQNKFNSKKYYNFKKEILSVNILWNFFQLFSYSHFNLLERTVENFSHFSSLSFSDFNRTKTKKLLVEFFALLFLVKNSVENKKKSRGDKVSLSAQTTLKREKDPIKQIDIVQHLMYENFSFYFIFYSNFEKSRTVWEKNYLKGNC